MKITFITHSSFLVGLDKCNLLFDYFDGNIPEFDREKPLYVFASHSHPDHFSEKVFEITKDMDKVHYILSNDIFEHRVPRAREQETTFAAPNEKIEVDELKIETLASTDLGVAFVIEVEGKRIYHAGDLNCWVWAGSPEYQNTAMTNIYIFEMQKLKDKLDVAFVPLDPRQEQNFDLGMNYFLRNANADKVFPMHMWNDFSVIESYKKRYPQYSDVLMDIEKDGQIFEI